MACVCHPTGSAHGISFNAGMIVPFGIHLEYLCPQICRAVHAMANQQPVKREVNVY
jgi:hypothetical protein